MTVCVENIVILTDADCVEVSHARAIRIAQDIAASILRHMPDADPMDAEDAARNIAQAFGGLGLVHDEGAGQ